MEAPLESSDAYGAPAFAGTIDSHQHFWPAGLRPRDPKTLALDREFAPGDLSDELAGSAVTGTVLVQCVAGQDENERLVAYAEEFPPVRAIVAWLPLDDVDEAVREAARVRARTPLLRGFRAKTQPSDGASAHLLRTTGFAADEGLVWELVVTSDEHVRLVEEVSAARPDLRIVVDHLATPPLAGGDHQAWRERIDRLAALPSVAIKLSVGLDVLVDWRWEPSRLTEFVGPVLDQFGPHRAMLAGNWPVVRLAADHSTAWSALMAATEAAGASPAELVQISSGTARSWYRIDDPPT